MTEQQVLDHLNVRIPPSLRLGGGGFFQRILDLLGGGIVDKVITALRELLGQAGFNVDVAIAAAKKFYDTWADTNGLPVFIDAMIWAVLERSIRRMFASQP